MKERVITANIVRNDMFLMACEGYIRTLSIFIVEYSSMNKKIYISETYQECIRQQSIVLLVDCLISKKHFFKKYFNDCVSKL